MNKRILIVDQNNFFIRSYIVDPTLSHSGDRSGQPIGGLMGSLKSLQKVIREVIPDRIIIVWDGAQGSRRRRNIDENYKMGRKPIRLNRSEQNLTEDEELENKIWQMSRLAEYYEIMPVSQFVVDGVEADDIISCVSKSPIFKDDDKVILSSDKDFIQLLDRSTILYRPVQKQIWTINEVVDKFGIHPYNFVLARAIVGDSSDNISGVPGIGLPTIAKRFDFLKEEKQYLLDDIYKKCENPPKNISVYSKILKNKELIEKNYRLMSLTDPQISIQAKTLIDEELQKEPIKWKKFEFDKMTIIDGFAPWGWETLYGACARISYRRPVG